MRENQRHEPACAVILKKLILLALVAVCADSAFADFEIYLLRHGETSWNRAHVLQGSVAYTDLTPRGVRMAERTGEGMRQAGLTFDRLYASPYRRALRTAEIVGRPLALTPVADERIREMRFGPYEGRRYLRGVWADDNQRRLFEDPATFEARDGAESFAEAGARVRAFLEGEVAPLDGKVNRILCVTHAMALKSLLLTMFGGRGLEPGLMRNCSVVVLTYARGRFVLKETGRVFYDPAEFEACPMPRTVAHRGAGDLDMPEATLPAYSNAVATVSDIVKLDVQATKDGVAVMGHDETLKRNMGWDVRIDSLDYAEIRSKGVFKAVGGYDRERIVRLDEVLPVVKAVPEFWIDFKTAKGFTPAFAEKVLETFRAAGIDESRLMVATFNVKAIRYFQEKHPAIRRVKHQSAGTSVERVLVDRNKYGLFGVNMCVLKGNLAAEDVKALRQNGLWVSLWFVQNAGKAKKCLGFGADAFVTDHVSDVRAAFGGI